MWTELPQENGHGHGGAHKATYRNKGFGVKECFSSSPALRYSPWNSEHLKNDNLELNHICQMCICQNQMITKILFNTLLAWLITLDYLDIWYLFAHLSWTLQMWGQVRVEILFSFISWDIFLTYWHQYFEGCCFDIPILFPSCQSTHCPIVCWDIDLLII